MKNEGILLSAGLKLLVYDLCSVSLQMEAFKGKQAS